ncbi:MAG: DUF4242 domain-containing protein [Chloroflexota bacterium]|nr:MAG: DUF4242 domain-containing protein [Chloroflexota bacterium]
MLFLVEASVDAANTAALDTLFDAFRRDAARAAGELVEVHVSRNLNRAYVVIEHTDGLGLEATLREQLTFESIDQVRLVGAELADVKAVRGEARFLVEWDFPPTLTMETYLARKKEKAPLYAQIPEVTFLRTYVREDMVKCLCFYDGPDSAAVCRARDIVGAPVHRLSELQGAPVNVG